MSVKMQTK